MTIDIVVIPNFLDCAIHRRLDVPDLRQRFTGGDSSVKIVTHVSNFRPVKRIEAVLEIFDRIRRACRRACCSSAMVPTCRWRAPRSRAGHRAPLDIVGAQEEVVPLLSVSDVFLLPSAQESFGLAALEAMACEVPVVASRVGGLPEVIEHGVSGFLHPPDALDEMAASAIALLTDSELHRTVAAAACRRVRVHFCADRVVPMYEECYRS